VRDLERLKEVRDYRVTGPQLGSLFGLAALVVVAAFVAGFEVGLWQRPVDTDLLSPGGAQAEREAGEVLAALIAERVQESELEEQAVPERIPAPPLSESLDKIDAGSVAPDATVTERSVGEEGEQLPPSAASAEDGAAAVTLTARDDTVLPTEHKAVEPTPEVEQPPPAPEVVTAPASEPVPSVEEVVASVPAPSAEPELPTLAEGRQGFTVQLAAYETPSEASVLIKSLQAQGFEAFHQRAQVGDTTWYRVRVGLHPTRASAEKEAARLAKASPFTPYVTSHP